MQLKKLAESLNDFSFSFTIPSTKKEDGTGGKVCYGRPYTIKDMFKLSQLVSQPNKKMMMEVMFDIVKDKYYSLTKEDFAELTMSDVSLMFVELKKQSDDNNLSVNIFCHQNQEHKIEAVLHLNEIYIKNANNFCKTITIKNEKGDIVINLKQIPFKEIIENYSETYSEKTIKDAMINSIHSVCYGEEVFLRRDIDRSELEFFVDNIPQKYLKEFEDFHHNSPELAYPTEYKCKECGALNTVEVSDFFYSLFSSFG